LSLADQFNGQYTARKSNDYVLDLYYSVHAGSTYISFDFMTRAMFTRNGHGDGGIVVTPFSQLDRDMLINMRDTLIELGGKPPELAPEPSTLTLSGKKFNL
jgi:hypothetical protein